MQITHEGIDALIQLVDDLCGVYLDHSKGYLIESRLESIASTHACKSFGELAGLAKQKEQAKLRDEIVGAITTHETLFFRDHSPFDALRFKVLPELIDQVEAGLHAKRLRIWSAACSTGQEPYSLAMILREVIPDIDTWNVTILGTDVASGAVEKAKTGYFSELEMSRGMDSSTQSQFFVREGAGWRICEAVRRLVQFETRNLLTTFSEVDHFDIVLCRNVAIYFRKEQRGDLFRRLVRTMAPGAFLFVGSAESLVDLGNDFKPQTHCNCTVYRPKPCNSLTHAK